MVISEKYRIWLYPGTGQHIVLLVVLRASQSGPAWSVSYMCMCTVAVIVWAPTCMCLMFCWLAQGSVVGGGCEQLSRHAVSDVLMRLMHTDEH